MDYSLNLEEDESHLFFPQSNQEAHDQVNQLLHQTPYQHGIAQSRWRLQDVRAVINWLDGKTIPGVFKILKRLGFSKKQALYFMRSPDPDYRDKWQRILQAYSEAVARPEEVIMLFQDEFTYYRKAEISSQWQTKGTAMAKVIHKHGPNTKARIAATLNAVTGKLTYLQRNKIGVDELAKFYRQVRSAYPDAKVIYLVQDNWPVHKHDHLIEQLETEDISPLFLPTYASWLNPIEKLWRWLRQEVLHNHQLSHHFKSLRKKVAEWLEEFVDGSLELLIYVGLLSKAEVDLYQY